MTEDLHPLLLVDGSASLQKVYWRLRKCAYALNYCEPARDLAGSLLSMYSKTKRAKHHAISSTRNSADEHDANIHHVCTCRPRLDQITETFEIRVGIVTGKIGSSIGTATQRVTYRQSRLRRRWDHPFRRCLH